MCSLASRASLLCLRGVTFLHTMLHSYCLFSVQQANSSVSVFACPCFCAKLSPGCISSPAQSPRAAWLRSIWFAGLWTTGNGEIECPLSEDMFFLPQQPFMPLGTLRQQLLFPSGHSYAGLILHTPANQHVGGCFAVWPKEGKLLARAPEVDNVVHGCQFAKYGVVPKLRLGQSSSQIGK